MLRIVKAWFFGWLFVPFFFAPTQVLQAQELHSERPLQIRPEIFARSGVAPVVVNCASKDQIIECSADRKLKSVECRDELDLRMVLKSEIATNRFRCSYRVSANNEDLALQLKAKELSTSLVVYALSEDGQFSEWIIRVSDEKQMTRRHTAEMQAIAQVDTEMPSFELGTYLEIFSAASASLNFVGVQAKKSIFAEQIFAKLHYAFPMSSSVAQASRSFGAHLNLQESILESVLLHLDLAYLQMGEAEIANLKSTELGFGFAVKSFSILNWDMGFYMQWPDVEFLTQSMELRAKILIGPFFQNWRFDVSGGFLSRAWQDSRGDQRGYSTRIQLGATWVN